MWWKVQLKLLALIFLGLSMIVNITACNSNSQTLTSNATQPADKNNVMVKSFTFEPPSIVVTVGMTVTWNNEDDISYSIADNNETFAFTLPARGSFSITFSDIGTYNYHCSEQPEMQGTIIVMPGNESKSLNNSQDLAAEVVGRARASIVQVDAEIIKNIHGQPFIDRLAGTGIIIDNSGLIMTNNHVVQGAEGTTVVLTSGQVYQAQIVSSDPIDDLALLKIDAGNLQAAAIGDSSIVKIGDPVIAMGNAMGQGIVATQGIISNTDSSFQDGSGEVLFNVFQTTAPINHGNSGGPLLNMEGQVIGITTAANMTPTGQMITAYAITSNNAEFIVRQLILNGYVPHGFLGVFTSNVSELISTGYKLAVDKGAFITDITANSPAEKSGLKAGDVILKVNGENVTSSNDLLQQVRKAMVGQSIEITFWRDNNIKTTTTRLVQNPIE